MEKLTIFNFKIIFLFYCGIHYFFLFLLHYSLLIILSSNSRFSWLHTLYIAELGLCTMNMMQNSNLYQDPRYDFPFYFQWANLDLF